jgi:hypothetical protein
MMNWSGRRHDALREHGGIFNAASLLADTRTSGRLPPLRLALDPARTVAS